MNKVTGLLLFLLPFTMPFIDAKYTAIVVCAVATLSAIQEGVSVIADSVCK
jgi:CDP-diacylglycerol--glycerol-3-phosphate 3-phosphatidyltransferase